MDLLFLGTSSGTPTRQRNVSALALQPENSKSWFLVDCGEATQHQLLSTPLSLKHLAAIFITHVHGDHCYGLPGLLASAAMSGRRDKLTLVAPLPLRELLEVLIRTTDLHLGYEIEFVDVAGLDVLTLERYCISRVALSHRVPSYAYVFEELGVPRLDTGRLEAAGIPRGALWGRVQQGADFEWQGQHHAAADFLLPAEPGRKLVVAGDNDTPLLLEKACQGAQLLVHESTYTADVEAKVGPAVQHCSAARIAAFAQEVGLPNLLLTHFSPRYQDDESQSPSIAELRDEAAAHYDGRLWLASDFARFRLDKNGVLSSPTA